MIQLVEASKAYGAQVLLREVSWQVGAGDRVGLVGPNGSGKSTLLKILARRIPPDSGKVVLSKRKRVGYLPQEGLRLKDRTVAEEVRTAFAHLLQLRREQEDLARQLEHAPDQPAVVARYGELEEEWQHRGGYEMDTRISEILSGLGFAAGDEDRPVETFSQGWQMRIALARLLAEANDLVLLDEPTNYLDIEARTWLLGFLSRHRGGLVLVAHDRYFLDAVVTRITEIGLGRLGNYPGTYSKYEARRAAEIADLRKRAAEQAAEIERTERFISRFRYQASRARQVQSRVRMLEKIERIEVPPEPRRVALRLPHPPRSGRVLVTLTGVRKAFGDNEVFRGVDLVVERGQRLALVGPNGAGKSTLIRLVAGELGPDAGQRELGHNVRTAYYGPDRHDLDPSRTVRETMADAAPLAMLPEVRNILGAFLFSGDTVDKKTAVLSGGERSRLALARLFLRPANLLLLDEPTNHLDLDAKAALLNALSNYQGTIVFVAHDRYFMDALATRVAAIGGGGAALYWGNYSDYLTRISPPAPEPQRSPRPEPQAAPAAKRPGRKAAPESRTGAHRPPGKNRLRQLRREWREVFEAIADTEAAVESLEARMAAPGFFGDREGSREVTATYEDLKSRLPALYEELERLDAAVQGNPASP
jgi:ATP-binding cassette subfamily F protein 3